jgi:glycosyltransferase involved in cell wall biosynthesis
MRILIVSQDWDYRFARPQQLAMIFSERHDIVYVASSPGIRTRARDVRRGGVPLRMPMFKPAPHIRAFTTLYLRDAASAGELRNNQQKFAGRLRLMFPDVLRNIDLAVLTSPLDLGLLKLLVGETRRRGDTETRRHGDTETRRYGDTEIRSHGNTETGSSPRLPVSASPRLPKSRPILVYDCLDRYEDFYPEGSDLRALLLEREKELMDRADFVFASSRLLVEDKSRIRPTHYLPHGVDVDRFEQGSRTVPDDMIGMRRPIVGFVGAIEAWLDLDWVKSAAQAMPDVSFVMIGDVRRDLEGLDRAPNVHLPGYRPYDDVPSYTASFDVCMIPFLINRLTAAVNPVKVLEYFALGKPVVSSYMPELERYAPSISLVRTGGEFVAAIRTLLAADNPDAPAERKRIARSHSWRAVAEGFLQVVEGRSSDTGF